MLHWAREVHVGPVFTTKTIFSDYGRNIVNAAWRPNRLLLSPSPSRTGSWQCTDAFSLEIVSLRVAQATLWLFPKSGAKKRAHRRFYFP